MFTLEQIELAHSKVKSGADFPKYIQEIKEIGVSAYETWVCDNHTLYFGKENFKTSSKPKYEEISIATQSNSEKFKAYLKIHQQGGTDYFTFCNHCAETGIEKCVVNLDEMTCTYYDRNQIAILVEIVPN